MQEYGIRLIGLGMKERIHREVVRSWPTRGYDDTDFGPSFRDLKS
jgi:hypothetical protein